MHALYKIIVIGFIIAAGGFILMKQRFYECNGSSSVPETENGVFESTGETNLKKLLQNMEPNLNEGEFVFCNLTSLREAYALNPIYLFQEKEGITVIIPKVQADKESFPCSGTYAWITLTVHSSLEAVGLTAAVSKALTEANISCNVVAAYYHDHIFVPSKDAHRAMDALRAISSK